MQEKNSAENRDEQAVEPEIIEQKRQAQSQVLAGQTATFFEGPLPHPDMLEQYERILPGIADRIVTMAEAEQMARHVAIEQDGHNKAALVAIAANESNGALKAQQKGQNIGLFISIVCVIASFICALYDKPITVTCAFLAVPTASFIGSFMPKFWTKASTQDKKDGS